jgi:hypothetical protein
MSAYVKSLDPHHLVTVGSHGYYGKSTPARLKENPFTYNVYGAALNNGAPYAYNAVCEGADFRRNFAPDVSALLNFQGGVDLGGER